jgi:hypothetical protein
MNEFVVQEMILSGFCQDDFVERMNKALIPVPLLPSKAFRKIKKINSYLVHIQIWLNLPKKLNVCTFIYLAHSQIWLNLFRHELSLELHHKVEKERNLLHSQIWLNILQNLKCLYFLMSHSYLAKIGLNLFMDELPHFGYIKKLREKKGISFIAQVVGG